MQVILAEEQTLEIQHMIGELIKSEVKNARESVGADSPFLNKRCAAAVNCRLGPQTAPAPAAAPRSRPHWLAPWGCAPA